MNSGYEMFGHDAFYIDSRGERLRSGCNECRKHQRIFNHDLEDASPEQRWLIEAYMTGYFIEEPCELDEESILPSKDLSTF